MHIAEGVDRVGRIDLDDRRVLVPVPRRGGRLHGFSCPDLNFDAERVREMRRSAAQNQSYISGHQAWQGMKVQISEPDVRAMHQCTPSAAYTGAAVGTGSRSDFGRPR